MNYNNIEKVEVLTTNAILRDLQKVDANTSADQFGKLIKDISALLISRNTVTGSRNDILLLINDISELLYPLLEDKYIQFRTEAIICDREVIPFIFITSPEEKVVVINIAERMYERSTRPPIEIEVPILHAHIDTTKLIEPYASLTTFIDNKETFLDSLLLGRGVIDMKSQIAVLVIATYLFHSLNKKPPMIILTCDEEEGSQISGDMMNQMFPRKEVYDLEPSLPDHVTNEIWPSSFLSFTLGSRRLHAVNKYLKRSDMAILKSLKKCAYDLAKYYYPEPNYDIQVITDRDRFRISIIDNINYKAVQNINKEFISGIFNEINEYFIIKDSSSGPYPSMQSDLSPVMKSFMKKTLSRRPIDNKVKPLDVLTKTVPENDIEGRSSIRHNFASAASLTFGQYGIDNIGIIGPRELGHGRHSKLELLLLSDGVILLMNLVELLSQGEQIFKES